MIEEKEVYLSSEENESEKNDTETPSTPKEINTYNSIPFNSYDNYKNEKKPLGIRPVIHRFYSAAAIITVLLAVVFSSAEIFDFVINDMGTGNMIMERIFSRDLMGQGLNLNELIIKNSFITPEEKLPSSSAILSPEEKPIESTSKAPPATSPESTEKPPESSKIEATTTPAETDAKIPENGFPILPMDMSLLSYGKYYIYNDTELSPNVSALASKELTDYYRNDAPLVLVIHTHGTESYMPEGAKYYQDDGEIARSQNTEENMIAVGKEFVRVLEENGIPTLHCTIMHDKESYRDSYSRSAESIKKYLAEYPSIKYVFDLHRDSLMRSTGELISAVTSINGENCAQVMPVVGSGFSGWESNMTFALKLREGLNNEFINLCRPTCLRASTYNQNMSAISVLIEIGTSGNTLPEAKKAAILTARTIAEIIKE